MATPTIIVNVTGGSDTAASGAGPATAITGASGRTRNTASQLHFGFFGATDDFSGVATDGTAVLYMAISTAGQRNFSSIAAIRNTRDTTTGNITSGAAVLSALGSTSGWSVGDVIKVTGAGAAGADLYSTILTVDSGTQVTLNDNAGTTVTGGAVENPKQATLTTSQGVNTGATNTSWAVGGKRASVFGTNSAKLYTNNGAAGDAMPGWIVEMQSGHSESAATAIVFRRAGDTTSGPIVLRGESGAVNVPIIQFTANGTHIQIRANFIQLKNFATINSNATKTASIGVNIISSAEVITIERVYFGLSTFKIWRGITLDASATFNIVVIRHCTFDTTADNAVRMGGVNSPVMYYNTILNAGGNAVHFVSNEYAGVVMFGNVIYNTTGIGVDFICTSTFSGARSMLFMHNTIDLSSSDGMKFELANTHLADCPIINNLVTNSGGFGINFSAAGFTTIFRDALGMIIDGNAGWNNSSGMYNPSGYGTNDPNVNPQYRSASTGDFTPTNRSLWGKGVPIGSTTPLGASSTGLTFSYSTPGAVQIPFRARPNVLIGM